MKKIKVILAGILVIFTLVLTAHTVTTQISKVAVSQNDIIATEVGPIYPPPMFSPRV